MNRIPSLDGLRALSIALVLLGHLAGTQGFFPEAFFLDDAADFGVRVFFVISGFLITHLLLDEREKTGSISLKQFYLRRTFRIFPAAWVYILVVIAFSFRDISKQEVIAAFLYLANFTHLRWTLAHLWSLSVEEQFYLLWPALLVLAFRRCKSIAVLTIAVAPILRAAFYLIGWKDVNHYFPTVADSIATGCLLALLQPQLSRWVHLARSRWFVLVPVTAVSMLLVDYWNRKVYNAVGLTVMHACIALTIYAAIKNPPRLLNTRPVAWLGKASYSIYLWQMPFCNRSVHAWWTEFPVNILLALLCGTLSLYLAERPILGLRRKLTSTDAAAEYTIPSAPQSGGPLSEVLEPNAA